RHQRLPPPPREGGGDDLRFPPALFRHEPSIGFYSCSDTPCDIVSSATQMVDRHPAVVRRTSDQPRRRVRTSTSLGNQWGLRLDYPPPGTNSTMPAVAEANNTRAEF